MSFIKKIFSLWILNYSQSNRVMNREQFAWVILMMLCYVFPAKGQNYIMSYGDFYNTKATQVSGHVQMKENETQRMAPLEHAGIRIFCLTDSTYHQAFSTNKEGNFHIYVYQARNKDYEIQISYIGTDTYKQRLSHANLIELDTITLQEKPITMEEAVIVAKLKKMRILGDTTIFNADAFKVSEGAVLLELVRKMPGLRISDGKMTYQGKNISEILLNGEKFFSNDINIALQNLPANLLKEVRIYDKQTEESETKGVDDGKRNTVMDLKTKRKINNAWMGNIGAGGGDQKLYAAKGMLNYFETEGNMFSVFASQHNTPNDISMGSAIGSIGGFNGGSGGNPAKQLERSLGANAGFRLKKELHLNGNTNYSEGSTDTRNYTISENYLPTGNTYSDESSLSSSNNDNLNASIHLNGQINKQLYIMGSFTFGNNHSQSLSENRQALFNQNPYTYTSSPLNNEDAIPLSERINRIEQKSMSQNNGKNFNGMLLVSKRFNEKGRSLSFGLNAGIDKNQSKNFQQSYTRYYQLGDSTLYQNRFTYTPNNNQRYSANISYNEPLSEKFGVEVEYEISTSRNKSDENVYDIGKLTGTSNITLGKLPEGYLDTRIDSLSNINHSNEIQHNISLGFNMNFQESWDIRLSLSLLPGKQDIYMLRDQHVTDTTTNRLNFSSMLALFYSKNKTSLNLNYNSSSNSPDINQLLPTINNDNPLFITKGNPNLKSSFRHSINANLRINTLWINTNISQSFNDITYKTDYNPITGVRTSFPDNINGNWDFSGIVGYSKDWERFSLEVQGQYNYSNNVSYIVINDKSSKNKVQNQLFNPMLKGTYNPDWGEFILSGEVSLNHTKDKLQNASNSFTKTYNLQAETAFYLPWNIQLRSTFGCITRSGFLSEEMNHSELLWNAYVSYSFLKKKQANLKLEIYDILQRSTNFYSYTSPTSNIQSRSEGVNSYFLLTFNYRFNLFKGKNNEEN